MIQRTTKSKLPSWRFDTMIHHDEYGRDLERTGQMDALRNMIIERKVIEMITENATFNATKFHR